MWRQKKRGGKKTALRGAPLAYVCRILLDGASHQRAGLLAGFGERHADNVAELEAFLAEIKEDASREELLQRIESNDRLESLVKEILGDTPGSSSGSSSGSKRRFGESRSGSSGQRGSQSTLS